MVLRRAGDSGGGAGGRQNASRTAAVGVRGHNTRSLAHAHGTRRCLDFRTSAVIKSPRRGNTMKNKFEKINKLKKILNKIKFRAHAQKRTREHTHTNTNGRRARTGGENDVQYIMCGAERPRERETRIYEIIIYIMIRCRVCEHGRRSRGRDTWWSAAAAATTTSTAAVMVRACMLHEGGAGAACVRVCVCVCVRARPEVGERTRLDALEHRQTDSDGRYAVQ